MDKIYIPRNDIIVPKGKVAIILGDKYGRIKEVDFVNNLITDAAKDSMADALRGTETSNQGIITYCAVGTDATAPEASNTTLGSELFRKLVSVRSVDGNDAIFETYFTTSEANGSLKEAGLFGDDAGETTDSGTLFAHTAIDRTKTSNDTLTLNWTVTIG